jgi:ferredoxin--NADP+ reductase
MPHREGRVLDPEEPVPGLYCSGWIKRGANGVIGTNKADAAETVISLLEDFTAGALPDSHGDAESCEALVTQRQPHVVDFASWARIDDQERARGREANRSRVKFVSIEELLEASRLPVGEG